MEKKKLKDLKILKLKVDNIYALKTALMSEHKFKRCNLHLLLCTDFKKIFHKHNFLFKFKDITK